MSPCISACPLVAPITGQRTVQSIPCAGQSQPIALTATRGVMGSNHKPNHFCLLSNHGSLTSFRWPLVFNQRCHQGVTDFKVNSSPAAKRRPSCLRGSLFQDCARRNQQKALGYQQDQGEHETLDTFSKPKSERLGITLFLMLPERPLLDFPSGSFVFSDAGRLCVRPFCIS